MGIIIPKNEKNNKKKMILRQNFRTFDSVEGTLARL